jgi:hypothetical protein
MSDWNLADMGHTVADAQPDGRAALGTRTTSSGGSRRRAET